MFQGYVERFLDNFTKKNPEENTPNSKPPCCIGRRKYLVNDLVHFLEAFFSPKNVQDGPPTIVINLSQSRGHLFQWPAINGFHWVFVTPKNGGMGPYLYNWSVGAPSCEVSEPLSKKRPLEAHDLGFCVVVFEVFKNFGGKTCAKSKIASSPNFSTLSIRKPIGSLGSF